MGATTFYLALRFPGSLASGVATGLAALALVGCGTDLGSCDAATSQALVYDGQGVPFYAGQFVVAKSCSAGFCHSAQATRGRRLGAPAELNFDVATVDGADDTNPATRRMRDGKAVIDDWAERMYGTVESGWMPPGEAGDPFRAHDACTDDATLVARLPPGDPATCDPYGLPSVRFDLDDDATRDVLRNWLACDAPLVERTQAPASGTTLLGDVVPARSAVQPTFASIWSIVLSDENCTGCHQPDLPPSQRAFYELAGELDLSDRQTAFRGLLGLDGEGAFSNAEEVTPQGCRGSPLRLVEPGDPDGSILVEKLEAYEGDPASCGEAMPIVGSAVPQSTIDTIRLWIENGATNDGCVADGLGCLEPADCCSGSCTEGVCDDAG